MDCSDIRSETLRYLGYRGMGLSAEISKRLDKALKLCLNVAVPRHVSREFNIRAIHLPHSPHSPYSPHSPHSPRGLETILVDNTTLELCGDDIRERLVQCKSVTLFAATLGGEIDTEVERVSLFDKSLGLMLNAAAAALIERYCDTMENVIADAANARGLFAVPRFSPGYGDLTLDIQPKFLDVLDAHRRLGITCNAACLMSPRKSVTAIIGLSAKMTTVPPPIADRAKTGFCDGCTLRNSCEFNTE